MTAPRTPPCDLVAESAVLNSVLLEPALARRLDALGLAAEHFYLDAYGYIWSAMQALRREGVPLDTTTLRAKLVELEQLQRVGGDEALLKLGDTIPTAANIEAHARIVLEKAARRQVIHAAYQCVASAYGTGPIDDALEAARQVLAVRVERGDTALPLHAVVDHAVDSSRATAKGIGGIEVGFHVVDSAMQERLQPGEVVTVSGRSGCGKSHTMLGIAMHAAKRGHTVGVVSCEDSARRWGLRAISALDHTLSKRIVSSPQINLEQRQKIEAVREQARELKLFFENANNGLLQDVIERAQSLVDRGCEVVVVDHIHAIEVPLQRGETTSAGVSRAVKSIKRVTQNAGAVLVLGAQIGRPEKHAQFKEPTMFDLRDSSQLEIASDVILMQWKTSDESRAPIYGKVEKLKDEPDRPRYRLAFGDMGALEDLEPYTPPSPAEGGDPWAGKKGARA